MPTHETKQASISSPRAPLALIDLVAVSGIGLAIGVVGAFILSMFVSIILSGDSGADEFLPELIVTSLTFLQITGGVLGWAVALFYSTRESARVENKFFYGTAPGRDSIAVLPVYVLAISIVSLGIVPYLYLGFLQGILPRRDVEPKDPTPYEAIMRGLAPILTFWWLNMCFRILSDRIDEILVGLEIRKAAPRRLLRISMRLLPFGALATAAIMFLVLLLGSLFFTERTVEVIFQFVFTVGCMIAIAGPPVAFVVSVSLIQARLNQASLVSGGSFQVRRSTLDFYRLVMVSMRVGGCLVWLLVFEWAFEFVSTPAVAG